MSWLAASTILCVVSAQVPDSVSDNIALCRSLVEGESMPNADDNAQASEQIDFATLDCDYWLEIDKIRRETGYVGWDSLPVPQREPF